MTDLDLGAFADYIFNTSNDCIFIMAVEPEDEYRCLAVNDAYIKNTKLKPEQVIGKTLKEIMRDKAYLTAFNGYNEAINTRQKVKYIEKVDFGFGEDIVETTITPVFDNGGRCTHLVGAAKDIKPQTVAEKALAETEERYKLLADHASDSIVLYDKFHNVLYVSPSTEKLSGYSLAELTKQPFLSMVHKDDLDDLKKSIALTESKKLQHQIYQYRYQRKDGQYIWMETNSTRIFDKNGDLYRIVTVNRDITNRKVLEEKLSFHSLILDQIHDRVTVTDLEGKITYVNNAVERMLGIDSGSIIGKSVKTYGENPNKGATQQEIIDGTLQKGSWNGTVVNREPDGKEHYLNVRTQILKNYNDEAIGMCGISTDITEQKLHEELLLESEMRYSNLFNNMVDGFSLNEIITDENGNPVDWRFLHVNRAHQKQTGLKMEDTIGKTIKEIFPDVEQDWIDFYGHVALTGEAADKVSFNHNTGNYYEVNAFSPSPGKFAAIFNNITDRILAERQLLDAKEKTENSERKLRSMFDNTLTGIMFCTKDGQVVDANKAMLNIVGSPSLETSLKLNLLEHELLKKVGFADNFLKSIAERTVIGDETHYTSLYGKTSYLKYFLIPIFNKEELHGVWVNVHDMTDLWKIQTDLKEAKEKAEAADQLKTAFLNNISHEVRTPLNGILGFGEILVNHACEEEEKQYYLEILHTNSNRLMQTITDYMDISLITSGNQEVHLSEVKPFEMIKTCYDDYLPKCSKKGIELHMMLPENSEEETITSDPGMLQKSLYHLVENAWKFTDKGKITIGFQSSAGQVEFFVSDTGKGIVPENHDRIFGNFVQEDNSNTRGYEGSGLGLSIVKGFTGLLGGNITLISEKNSGSTFRIMLPKKQSVQADTEQKPETSTQAKKTGNYVILIVEDDESVFEYFEAIFNHQPCTLLKAYNGESAISVCDEHPEIDLVLMDLKMPVMNGFEATKIIKQMRPTLPVIAQTAYALAGDEHRARQAGCDDYITKPIKRSKLFEKMKKFGFDEGNDFKA